MPPIPADKLTPAQKKAVELLVATPRGAAGPTGPFIPLLRSPELMNRLQAVGEYLRFHNSVPQKLVEMTTIMAARQFAQQYEWDAHYPLALKAGLSADTANAIAAGRRPESSRARRRSRLHLRGGASAKQERERSHVREYDG